MPVPPFVTATGVVRENWLPVSVRPVPAVYEPTPPNWLNVIAVVFSVPPWLEVHTQPVSAFVVPSSTHVNAPGTSNHVSMSIARVGAPEALTV